MSEIVNTGQARSQLSRLLRRVEGGEEVVIARAGKPVARLVAVQPTDAPAVRRKVPELGTAKGLFELDPDWDAPMTDDELAEWYDAPLTADPEPGSTRSKG